MSRTKIYGIILCTVLVVSQFQTHSPNHVIEAEAETQSQRDHKNEMQSLDQESTVSDNANRTISSSSIPVSILMNWLHIPKASTDQLFDVLIIGPPVSYNITYDGFTEIENGINSTDASTNNSDINPSALIELFLNPNFKLLNSTVTWYSLRFDSFNSTGLVQDLKSEVNITDYDSVIVAGSYFGHPLDTFNTYLANINQLGIPVFTSGINSEPYADLKSPANNPQVISISPLISTDDLANLERPENFKLMYEPPLKSNNYYKNSPDFILPGTNLLAHQTASPNAETKLLVSEHLPMILFAIGYLSLKNTMENKSAKELLQLIMKQSKRITSEHFNYYQQGFGIPRFSGDIANEISDNNYIDFLKFGDSGNNITQKVSPGQMLYSDIRMPYFSDFQVDNSYIISNNQRYQVADINFGIKEVKSELILNENTISTEQFAWKFSKLYYLTVQIPFGLEDGLIELRFDVNVETTSQKKSVPFIVDREKLPIAIIDLFESDGVYLSHYPTARFANTINKIDQDLWSISIIHSKEQLNQEFKNVDHLLLIMIDPDNLNHNNTDNFDEYLEKGGNILLFLDDTSLFESVGIEGISLYNEISSGLKEWFVSHSLQLNKIETLNRNPLRIYETGIPKFEEPYYLLPWNSSEEYLPSYSIFPFRGFNLTNSGTNEFVNIRDYQNQVRQFSSFKVNQGILSVSGSISPLINSYDNNFNFNLPHSANLLNNIIKLSSRSQTSLSIKPEALDVWDWNVGLQVKVHFSLPMENRDRFVLSVTGDKIHDDVYPAYDNQLIVKLKSSADNLINISIELMQNHAVMDAVSIELELKLNKIEKLLVIVMSSIMVLLVMYIVKLNFRLKE